MSSRPSGTICTPDELVSSNSTTLHCLTRGDSLGLLVITQASFISLAAVSYVFLVILWNIGRLYIYPYNRGKGLKLFRQPMDLLMLSLFVADALQAIGGALNTKWITEGKVWVGDFCNAQGTIQNIGETGVAIFNLTISLYTLVGVLFKKDISNRATLVVITLIWLFIAIIVAVGNATHHNPPYESPTPYWCWIGKQFLVWRIVSEYMWFWLALLVSFLTYIPFLWIQSGATDRLRQGLIFLSYPLVYSLSVLPLSITRWIGFVQEAHNNNNGIPSAAVFASVSLFSLSGFFNVILLLNTKPNSGLFGHLVFKGPARPPSPTIMSKPFLGINPNANLRMSPMNEESSAERFGRLP